MREISYRAWLKDEKKMVEVKSIHFGTKKIIYGYSENSHSYGNVSCKFDDCEIMQYTGLKDKNGTKIFEGDIVKVLGMVGKIIYEYGSFGIAFDDCVDYKKLDDFTKIRIGNNFSGVCCDNFISLYEVYWNLNNLDECLHEVKIIGNVFDNKLEEL